jgi:hypothetical protein
MTDLIRHFLNTTDSAKPVYEVNYTTKRWRTVTVLNPHSHAQRAEGRLRKPTDFTNPVFREVERIAVSRGTQKGKV